MVTYGKAQTVLSPVVSASLTGLVSLASTGASRNGDTLSCDIKSRNFKNENHVGINQNISSKRNLVANSENKFYLHSEEAVVTGRGTIT